jgi:hypothetical protein
LRGRDEQSSLFERRGNEQPRRGFTRGRSVASQWLNLTFCFSHPGLRERRTDKPPTWRYLLLLNLGQIWEK